MYIKEFGYLFLKKNSKSCWSHLRNMIQIINCRLIENLNKSSLRSVRITMDDSALVAEFSNRRNFKGRLDLNCNLGSNLR